MQATPNAPLALAVQFRVDKLGTFSDMAGAPDAQPLDEGCRACDNYEEQNGEWAYAVSSRNNDTAG